MKIEIKKEEIQEILSYLNIELQSADHNLCQNKPVLAYRNILHAQEQLKRLQEK